MNDATSAREAELAVLAAPFADPVAADEARSILDGPGDFLRDADRTVWRAILDVRDREEAVDVVSVIGRLRDLGELERCGGAEYLADLMDTVPNVANVTHYARAVRDKARLRRLVDACQETVRRATDPEGDEPTAIFDAAERSVMEAIGAAASGEYVAAADVIWDSLALIEREAEAKGGVTGCPTGFPSLDWMTSGLHPGDLTIVAARPSMGKTAWALGAAMNAARRFGPTAIASLEMSREQLVKRALAMRSGVDLIAMRRGDLTDTDYAAIRDASTWIHTLPLHIDDTPGQSIPQLRAKIRRMVRRHHIKLLVVDYLQLMEAEGRNRTEQVTNISRGLKLIARESDIHIIALSQLNRAVESRTPPRPQLSDLRDSGSIEQDADVVLMLWRPEYYFDETTNYETEAKWQGRGELIVAKQRNGPTGKLLLQWDAKTTVFTEEQRSDGRVAA